MYSIRCFFLRYSHNAKMIFPSFTYFIIIICSCLLCYSFDLAQCHTKNLLCLRGLNTMLCIIAECKENFLIFVFTTKRWIFNKENKIEPLAKRIWIQFAEWNIFDGLATSIVINFKTQFFIYHIFLENLLEFWCVVCGFLFIFQFREYFEFL